MRKVRIGLALFALFILLAMAFVLWPVRRFIGIFKRKKRVKVKGLPFRVQFYFGLQRMNNVILKDSQQVTVGVQIEDAKGLVLADAQFDQPPAWAIDDPSLGDVSVSSDGKSAAFIPNGSKLGTGHLQFSCVIGGKPFQGLSEDLVVVAGDAAQVALVAQPPVDQPVPAPAV